MKSKELIRQIQELDPSGETEVCVDNADILHIIHLPAYYDGRLQVIEADEHYENIKARYVSKGYKIVLSPRTITEMITDFDNVEVDYSQAFDPKALQESHNRTRALKQNIELNSEYRLFVEWAYGKGKIIFPEATKELVERGAKWFMQQNIHPDNPLVELPPKKDKDGYTWHPSYQNRRIAEWDATVDVDWTGLDFVFNKRG